MTKDDISGPIARSVTKSVGIDLKPRDVFEYLADGTNWPQWAIVNVKSITKPMDSAWLDMVSINGPGHLRIRSDAGSGILDHDYEDSQANWTVPARVVANGRGSEFMMTFFQPNTFTDAFFDEQIGLVDIELAKLKQILESRLTDKR
jgi:hypothetical protein